METFSACRGRCFSITSVDRSNCFSVCGHSLLVLSHHSTCHCLSPSLAASRACLPSAHLLRLDLNIWAYSSLACSWWGSSGGLTCVAEGLTSALDIGPVPRYSSQGHLRFLLSSLIGITKDDRRAQGMMEPFLQHSFKAAFQVWITALRLAC